MAEKNETGRTGGLCPHGNFPSSCPICRQDNERREAATGQISAKTGEMESLMVFDEVGGRRAPAGAERTALEDRLLNELRQLKTESGQNPETQEVGFFEALRRHEEANLLNGQFTAYLATETKRRYDKDVTELTPNELSAIYASFPAFQELEEAEMGALEAYARAEQSWWQAGKTDLHDARGLRLDLEYRRALRLPRCEERDRTLDEAETGLRQLITSLEADRAGDRRVKNFGRRAEYQLIYLMRRWARSSELDNAIAIEHTLPREDQKLGIDHVLRLGDHQQNLDQKTLSPDEYQQEYQARLLKEAQQKARRVGGQLLVLESDRLAQAYLDDLAGRSGGIGKRHVVERLAEAVAPEDRELVERLIARPKKVRSEQELVKDKELAKFFDVMKLMDLGLITKSQARPGSIDAAAIMDAKKRVIKAAKRLKLTQTDLTEAQADIMELIQEALQDK